MLSVGGDPATVSRTIFSLAASGNLRVMGHDGITIISMSEDSSLGSQSSTQTTNFGESNTMSPLPEFTVAGKTFIASPSAFSIDESTLSAGKAGIAISGTLISLGKSGRLVLGTSTVTLPSSSIFKIAGQTDPLRISIGSTTLSAGQPGITISGTPISLATSGYLVIGSSTVALSQPTTDASFSTFIVDRHTYVGNASAVAVDGTTLSVGGPGAVISGTPISLKSSVILQIGTSDVPLPSNASSEVSVQPFTGAQVRKIVPAVGPLLGLMVFVCGIFKVSVGFGLI